MRERGGRDRQIEREKNCFSLLYKSCSTISLDFKRSRKDNKEVKILLECALSEFGRLSVSSSDKIFVGGIHLYGFRDETKFGMKSG